MSLAFLLHIRFTVPRKVLGAAQQKVVFSQLLQLLLYDLMHRTPRGSSRSKIRSRVFYRN